MTHLIHTALTAMCLVLSDGPDSANSTILLCRDWNDLYNDMLRGNVERFEAGKILRQIVRAIKEQTVVPPEPDYYFPIEGYGIEDVGGTKGDGYVPNRYNFLQGNNHSGHPAHDIFIWDDNQDCLDDGTKKPVHVLAMTEGIVLAVRNDWTSEDTLRGGNYIMIYNPNLDRYYYYAHSREVLVRVGDIIHAGQRISTVGRTGRNAAQRRSQTHLHLMVLQITDEKGKPVNFYNELKRAIRVRPSKS